MLATWETALRQLSSAQISMFQRRTDAFGIVITVALCLKCAENNQLSLVWQVSAGTFLLYSPSDSQRMNIHFYLRGALP